MIIKKILFVICNDGEARLIYPVYQALKGQGIDNIIIISTGSLTKERSQKGVEEALVALNMPFIRLTDYRTMDITKVLKIEQPDIVVLGSDQEFLKRSFVYAANDLHIPTLSLRLGISTNVANVPHIALKRTFYRFTHHLTNILHKYLYLLRTMVGLKWSPITIMRVILRDIHIASSADDAGGRFGCKAIAVAGLWEKRVLTERGVNPEKIYITGAPTQDISPKAEASGKEAELRKSLGIEDNAKVVLLLTTTYVEHGWWSPEMRTSFTNGIIDSLAPLLEKSVRLIIKIHPIENLDDYRKILGPRQQKVILRKDLPPSKVIGISDVVIAGYSTTVLEACALRKPVIVLNIFGEPEYLPYVEMGLATGVYHLNTLKMTVEKMLYDPSVREEVLRRVDLFFSQNRQSFDGKAIPRLTDLILQLAESHTKNLKITYQNKRIIA